MKKKNTQFVILGLGRFGLSILHTLAQYDVNILACDRDPIKLHDAAEYATHVVQVDVADEEALKKIGLGNFDVVILAMAEDLEASIIATMIAKELGTPFVLVKAKGYRQKKILESIGADQVVLPEHEMGEKTARNLLGFNIMDILEETENYAITEMRPMAEWIGKTLSQADIRKKHHLSVLALRSNNKLIVPVPLDRPFKRDDILITLSDPRKP